MAPPNRYPVFLKWVEANGHSQLQWSEKIKRYENKLHSDGLPADEVVKTIRIVTAHDEGVFYDTIYTGANDFSKSPNRLLMEAVQNRKPGKALDVGMGQGRNAIYLAQKGWQVTGFDVSSKGLAQAQRSALLEKVKITTVHAADEEFDFGKGQWDLISILYPLEKRSIYKVRQALAIGGIVVVECAHKEAGQQSFDTNELLKIFDGFRIVKYEDSVAKHEWAGKEMRLVRLIAQKQE
jgi:SAM-dependent methyltransferase